MSYKRILTIQDISCVGQCSLTVALPIISALGVETAVLPSAVLSTHTGGFSGYTFRDLTEDMPSISDHWLKEGITFDAFSTGYLGSIKQIEYIQEIMRRHASEKTIRIVDPVLGDNGSLYKGFNNDFVEAMKRLIASSDVILPNITEASMLTGKEYKESYDRSYIDSLLKELQAIGAKTIVMTGVSYKPETTGVVVFENNKYNYYEHKRIPKLCHGTGDIIASAFTGAISRGLSAFDASKLAADYTLKTIEYTLDDSDHWYGVKFELAIPYLVELIAKYNI